jgi:hypothetical protein
MTLAGEDLAKRPPEILASLPGLILIAGDF